MARWKEGESVAEEASEAVAEVAEERKKPNARERASGAAHAAQDARRAYLEATARKKALEEALAAASIDEAKAQEAWAASKKALDVELEAEDG